MIYPSKMKEVWKPIPGYEGLYDASSYGRIRSTPGKITSNALYDKRVWKSRIMKTKRPMTNKRPNRRVTLWKDGVPRDYLVSRLIAMAFHGLPISEDMTVNHIDGNWENDNPNNLEWVSRSENIKLGFQNNLYKSIQIPIILVSESGNSIKFNSMSEASRFLGKKNGYVSSAIKRKLNMYSSYDGVKYTAYKQR